MFMATNKLPQCSRCFGTNWIDIGYIRTTRTINPQDGERKEHLYQCGGGLAHTDPNDMKQGCGRVIRATPEEMNKGGEI